MARPKQPFSLFKRNRSKTKKSIYYAKFSTPDGEIKVSTGCSSKAAVQIWAMEQLPKVLEKSKIKTKPKEKKEVLFKDLAEGFWAKDGNYAKGRRARLRTISNGYLDSSECVTRNYLVPKWGKTKLDDFAPGMIDHWVIDLVEMA